jgi:hypothetical protein
MHLLRACGAEFASDAVRATIMSSVKSPHANDSG